ncbi:MAG: nitroreductase family protein [Planctomycetes bacterium]|nr:nitroreductase family protein [Planctomycetota bacterium]MBL7186504.1 nitroreductase family protein [Phycisphaerae bacterium]
MEKARLVPLDSYREYSPEEMAERAAAFRIRMQRRRSVRSFSSRPVARGVIEDCLLAAGSAPSGANMQPWSFVVVSDAKVKRRIREAAEEEEYRFYKEQAPEEWLGAISDLGTDYQKSFLETAPYLIVIFAQRHGVLPDGRKVKHYYVRDSVGIATGILIAAIHYAGLVSLAYTPSRMGFLNRILNRPENERASLVLVVGYPEAGTMVPDLSKKKLDETTTFM